MWQLLQGTALLLLMQTRVMTPGCAARSEWTFVVDPAAAPRTSAWLEHDGAPSLTPGAAARVARTFLQKMACTSGDEWEVHQIALRRLEGPREGWVYLVTFLQALHVPPGSSVGSVLRRQVEVPVLLNGVVPTVAVSTAGRN